MLDNFYSLNIVDRNRIKQLVGKHHIRNGIKHDDGSMGEIEITSYQLHELLAKVMIEGKAETFMVLVGNEMSHSRIISPNTTIREGMEVVEVPVDYLEEFYNDGNECIRKICNQPCNFTEFGPPKRGKLKPCAWKEFKGEECNYKGTETECDRSDERCIELGNYENYGSMRLVK